jgi:hypothetical protein
MREAGTGDGNYLSLTANIFVIMKIETLIVFLGGLPPTTAAAPTRYL